MIKKYSKNVGIDLAEFYYRLLFCFLTGNSDMHLKNFSLIEDKAGSREFGLSAAYDLLPVNVLMPADSEQMALTLNGKKRNIKKKDFLNLAQIIGMNDKAALSLIKQILNYKAVFTDILDQAYISAEMKKEMKRLIDERAKTLMA